MAEDLKRQITEFMNKCHTCTIATASADGQPSASVVFFKNGELDIYFNTGDDSEKVRNIRVNPRVAIAVQGDGPIPSSDREVKGLQYVGTATVLPTEDTSGVPMAVVARHNAFNSAKPGASVIVKVIPSQIHFIDYSKGFRHRDTLEL